MVAYNNALRSGLPYGWNFVIHQPRIEADKNSKVEVIFFYLDLFFSGIAVN